MKKFIGALWKAYRAGAVLAGIFLAILAAILYASGTLEKLDVRAGVQALKGLPIGRERDPAGKPWEEWRELERQRREVGQAQARREQELRRLDEKIAAELADLKVERQRAEEEKKLAMRRVEELEAERRRIQAAEIDKEIETNLPIFSKVEGAGLLALMEGWEDARIVRYLRAFKPAKAAEVLDAMQNDPQFEEGFRQAPPGTPAGTPTRVDRLMEEFKKVP